MKLSINILIIFIVGIGFFYLGGEYEQQLIKENEMRNILFGQYQLLSSIQNDLDHGQFDKVRGKIDSFRYIGIPFGYNTNPNGFIDYVHNQLNNSNRQALRETIVEALEILENGTKQESASEQVEDTLEQWNNFMDGFNFPNTKKPNRVKPIQPSIFVA